MQKVQPICIVCRKPIEKEDVVQIAKLFDQFTHFFCCSMDVNEIECVGEYGEMVNANKRYKKMYLVK